MSRTGVRRRIGVRAVAAIALAAMVGCGGSQTAGTRDEAAVTRPATASRGSAARSPVQPNPAAAAPEKAPSTAAQAPARQAPAAAATPRGEWRPDWWIDAPVQEGKSVRVAAMADDADLLEARRKAVSQGLSDLRATVDAAKGELLDAATTIDVISLPDGRYRAFVLVETGGQ